MKRESTPVCEAPEQFRVHVGDEVYLRSGSQRMCVESVCENGTHVAVVWMKYEEHEIRRDTLPIAVLDFKRRKA